MREIKFRYFRTKDNIMIPNSSERIKSIQYDYSNKYVGVEVAFCDVKASGEVDWNIFFEQSENIKLMQYTGLRDENGVEIYEGDIQKQTQGDHYWIYIVESIGGQFGNQLFSMTIKHNVSIDNEENRYTFEEIDVSSNKSRNNVKSGKNVQVVGNIYEHKHLLDALTEVVKLKEKT